MTILKRLLTVLTAIGTIGLLGFSTWHQWNANQGTILERIQPISPVTEFMHGARITDLVFSPTNQDIIATAGDDRNIKIWNRNNPDTPIEIPFSKKEEFFTLEYLNNGEFLLCKGILSRMTILWNMSTNEKIILPQEEHQWDTAISPSAETMATVQSRQVVLWNIQNPDEMTKTQEITEIHHTKYQNSFQCADFSPNGESIAIGFENGDIRIWDLVQEQFIKTLSVPPDSHVHLRNINYSPDGRWIVAREPASLTLWDTQKNQRHVLLEKYVGFLRDVKFSRNGKYIGITTFGKKTGYIIWSLPEVLIYHQVSEGIISRMAFSPDGKNFAVSNPGVVMLFSLESLTPITILQGKGILGGANEITFSADATMLAGAGSGGIVRLWDISNIYEQNSLQITGGK